MAESSCPAPTVTDEKSLDKRSWKVIGRGGFGLVFKARHLQWRRDVAVKLLFPDDGSSSDKYLLREAEHMRRAESPHVIQVLGVFKGCLPSSSFIQIGLVMELMERGSLASLQKKLNQPLPRSLLFRVAHQVALGMKHLHSLTPPLIHRDLKPDNILLDTDLNAKITDFGLAKFVNTVTSAHSKEAGTIKYMPPEAFSLSYTSTPAFDVYSYAILLWAIMMGKEPYEGATNSIIELRIPKGDRPSLEAIDTEQAPEMKDLVKLTGRCWVHEPEQRPLFKECTAVTEALYEKTKPAIKDAVQHVITELEDDSTEGVSKMDISQPPGSSEASPPIPPNPPSPSSPPIAAGSVPFCPSIDARSSKASPPSRPSPSSPPIASIPQRSFPFSPSIAARSSKASPSIPARPELRIVMIGRPGEGKSASGNTILGEKRFTRMEKCSKESIIWNNRMISVVDTPGFIDTHISEEAIRDEAVRCIRLSRPGPHVFLLVLMVGRFTREEMNAVETLQKLFGPEAHKYMMVLFTRGDDLEDVGITIQQVIREADPCVQQLIDRCGDRVHVFNNRSKDRNQVVELMQMIDDMVAANGGSCYTDEKNRTSTEKRCRVL